MFSEHMLRAEVGGTVLHDSDVSEREVLVKTSCIVTSLCLR